MVAAEPTDMPDHESEPAVHSLGNNPQLTVGSASSTDSG